jgi:AraC family transcriptional regulator
MAARGIAPGSAVRLGASHDDAAITEAARCTYDACVVVPRDFMADAPATLMDIPGGPCAVTVFAGGPHQIEDAWDRLFEGWLPDSGYQPDDRPCVEIYRGAPADRPTGTFQCELALPVRPL